MGWRMAAVRARRGVGQAGGEGGGDDLRLLGQVDFEMGTAVSELYFHDYFLCGPGIVDEIAHGLLIFFAG